MHLGLHGVQSLANLSPYFPSGQDVLHKVPSRKVVEGQLKQCEFSGPLQVAHSLLQTLHVLDEDSP